MSLFTRGDGPTPDSAQPSAQPSGGPDDDTERTVRIARKRFARRQWARRWLAWRRVVLALLLGGVVAGGVWLVFFSSVLAVSGVRVDGTAVLDPREVRRAAAVPLGTPLATVDLDAITARVENLPAVARVDVSRAWPDRVRVAVVERQAVAVVDRGDVLRGVDAEGVMFRRYPSRPDSLPVIRMGTRTRSDALAEAATVAAALPADIARRVDYVEVRTVDTISLALRNGRTVRWGSADESLSKSKVLAVLLQQKASTYDVSVPGQPIIRK
jgi:cell division protein FtsQ